MNVNIEKIAKEIKKENKTEGEEVKKKQEKRYEQLNKKLFFARVYIKRRFLSDGRHERYISIDDEIYQKHYDNIEAINTCYLLNGEARICKIFDTVEEAEEFVKEVVEEVKQELERIKEEYENEKQLREEEEIFVY